MSTSPRISILGAAEALAQRRVTSDWFDARFGRTAGWAESTTGVAERRFVGDGQTASQMAEDAARTALARAGIEPGALSAVLGASAVPEQPIPCFAVLVHRRLGLETTGIPAFDINATCLSFLAALRLAADQIAAGGWRYVLIVCGDIASAALDMDDPETAPLFGDGAAAIVVGPGDGELKAWAFSTYSAGAGAAWLGAGGSRLPARNLDRLVAESLFRMDGQAAFRVASTHIKPFVDRLLDTAGWDRGMLDLVVPHQASGRALDLMIRRLRLDQQRVIRTIATTGNMVAASMPAALVRALQDGRAGPGSRVMMIGTGAGISIAGACLVL
ncbi:MAG: ketoacyl-ACP synthase III [Rhodobiaceae bacterium]|nr:ketoacyl-ACP synthase III [Rhodobiaceae bacterium]